ncbi:amidase [uncultured Corynebacterium sp.]|uniref:amidase n=1 Tax=uncultured Corynebacterium sp. TaxID=159447 RepID=UPI0025F933BF|nr:amidase [uncultured Corynebacterium sp.]
MEFSVAQLARDLEGLTPHEHGFTYLDLEHLPLGHGRLDGWVLSAKDLSDVAGMPTSLGSAARRYMATVTDPFLAQLEDEGARIIGKSASPELGLIIDTEPTGMDWVDNPLWPGRTPGGSSGGAAVQVARGLLRAAHAGDGGGSIRVPAAACGIVGFKPAGEDLGVAGFMTTSIADQAILHDLRPVKPRARIGILTQPLFAEVAVDPVMLRAVAQARTALNAAGYECIDIDPYPQAHQTFESFRRIFTAHTAGLEDAEGYVAWVRDLGRQVSTRQLADARNHAAHLPFLLAHTWQVDAILTPMLAFDPPARGTFRALPHPENFDAQTRWSPWGSLFNVARLPAVCLPWEVPGRQPVGVQLGSITLSEPELLGLALELHA